ncbi:MAG: LD-carboxypeptidase [Bacteroidota bacterium]|nr:LD-carboxypeptidase [Bacteroidota bacterium]
MDKTPQVLKKEDKVAITATARKISIPEVFPSIQLFASWSLSTTIGKSIAKGKHQFSGSDKERAEDFQQLLDNEEIRVVFCARGGYGTAKILDLIDYRRLIAKPKWIVGYSDITAMLMHLYYKCNIESIHGIMPINITDNQDCIAYESLRNILFNNHNEIIAPYNPKNICGEVEGDMIGGNLSVIYSLLGSESFGATEGKILFIEDLDEYLYHIDRMLLALKRANKLKNIKALLVGQFTDLHDNEIPFGKDYKEIILDIMQDYNIPIAFDLPIGHIGKENHAFIHGRKSKVVIGREQTTIRQ